MDRQPMVIVAVSSKRRNQTVLDQLVQLRKMLTLYDRLKGDRQGQYQHFKQAAIAVAATVHHQS